LLKDGFVVNTILKEADLFCPNSVRINFTIYHIATHAIKLTAPTKPQFIKMLITNNQKASLRNPLRSSYEKAD
ncbi:hypothetical protein, partial [Lactiplantibacillus plantarum]|uniref:hypothetical protein n=1 Tax=Lactiplantibacillus plantarum TaxID=1590 RepID=UPI002738CBB1